VEKIRNNTPVSSATVVDEGRVTLAPEIAGLVARQAPSSTSSAAPVAPADAIPAQGGPSVTVSLTDGCDTPMDALRSTAEDLAIRCHPGDEAVVRLLVGRVRRTEECLIVSPSIPPGTLWLG
jgi:hypothetical protein